MRKLYAGFARLAALAALGAALGWNPAHAAAAQRPDAPQTAATQVASVRDIDLEDLFWRCDYAATVEVVAADERALCTAVAEQLKQERFGGDFERMLNWWQVNKAIQHQNLDRDDGANAAK
jgi:hypothetical protein